jgi:Alginate export
MRSFLPRYWTAARAIPQAAAFGTRYRLEPRLRRIAYTGLATSIVAFSPAFAQPAETEQRAPRPQYQSLRYEEDWSVLCDPSLRTDFWDPVKCIQLNDGGWYVSLGGESRILYEAFRNAAFGSGPQDSNGYVLQRYLAHADLHVGRHLRLFAEVQSGLETGRTGGPRPTDEDLLEFHQVFAELSTGRSPRAFTLRVGRQEVAFGSGRLISASEGRNVRRSFDAIRPIVRLGLWTWNGLLAKLVAVEPGMFDDGRDPRQMFGGFGFVRTRRWPPDEGTAAYYLRLHRRDAQFDQGVAREVRQTLGLRTWGRWAEVDYNYELIVQWGSFGSASIQAWGLATDTGYLLRSSRWPTRVGLRADLTTGDRGRDDPPLQTFNPLFPGTAYSGRAGLIGPANSIDVTPSVRVSPSRRLTVTIDHAWYLRQSVGDGLYGIAVNLIRPGRESRAHDVGRQFTAQADVQVDDHFTFAVTCTAFFASRFLHETPPGRDVAYVAVRSTYRF